MRCLIAVAAVALCLAATGAFAQTYTVLHNFAGGLTDGEYPAGGVVSDGAKLYGITSAGGANGSGILYAMNMDGSGFTILHSFGPAPDGMYPNGVPAPANGVLYGTTNGGGVNSAGTLYSIKTDGSAYTILYSYAGGTSWQPSPVVVSGDMIYGLTINGGTTDDGIAYSIKTDGTGYTVACNFAGSPLDGSSPWGNLLLENGTLYGATRDGGKYIAEEGTLFSMSPTGSNHAILHDFSGTDGAEPVGGLISDGSRLYGLTRYGGVNTGPYDSGGGTIFALDKNGANFQTLHDFTLDTAAETYGSKKTVNNLFCTGLARDGNRLYGTTFSLGLITAHQGVVGYTDPGAIFTLNTDGTGYTVLYSFDGILEGTGSFPTGTLLLENGALYGAAEDGGTEDMGVVYSFVIPPVPTPTPVPPVDLTANKTTFFTTDWIAVRANISVISTPCYLFVRFIMTNGQTLYYERGKGFRASPTPYLGFSRTSTVAAPIWNYPVLDTQFRGIATGVYYLEGGAIDPAKTTDMNNPQYVGTVDRNTLIVQ